MKKEESKYLRLLTNIWTLVTFAVIIVDAHQRNGLDTLLGPVLAVYTGVLALYSAEKEFERWKFYFIGRHPGETYVVAWTVLLISLFGESYITHGAYKVGPEILATYIVVLGILAITKKSKDFFIDICKKDNKTAPDK